VTAPDTTRRIRLVYFLPAAALVLAALCLRGPFAAVGPLVRELSDELALSTGALAVVTSLPLVCFALLSPFAPAVAARLGVQRAVLAGLVVLAIGITVRLGGGVGLFAGTVLLAGGIAVVNVLLPAAARAEYGDRSAAVVGATTAAIALSASIGAGLAEPLTGLAGSARIGLVLWLVPVLAAVLAVGLLARRRPHQRSEAPAPQARLTILRDRVALAVMLYFGLQSLSFYGMLTWLPDVLEAEAGVSPVAAGALLAVASALGAPAALVVPPLAARRPSQVPWVVASSVLLAFALLGLVVAPGAAPVVWALLYGFGTGMAFPLAFVLILERTHDVAQTGRLSAAAQSAGYLLAAAGPVGLGLLHEATGGWTTGLVVLLVALLGQTAAGVVGGRPGKVSRTA
jgi:CP family cyanate transporter-like MFS transporter